MSFSHKGSVIVHSIRLEFLGHWKSHRNSPDKIQTKVKSPWQVWVPGLDPLIKIKKKTFQKKFSFYEIILELLSWNTFYSTKFYLVLLVLRMRFLSLHPFPLFFFPFLFFLLLFLSTHYSPSLSLFLSKLWDLRMLNVRNRVSYDFVGSSIHDNINSNKSTFLIRSLLRWTSFNGLSILL